MTEKNNDEIELLFGLENYCEFIEKDESKDLIHEVINVLRSEDIKGALFNFCLRQLGNQNLKDPVFNAIKVLKRKNDIQLIQDSLSRGQVQSKIWLVNELVKINNTFDNVLIMAGWFGQLVSFYDKVLGFKKIRLLEIDKECCSASDYIFNLNYLHNHNVKSICADINDLTLHKNGYEWSIENFKDNQSYREKFLPNLIINTSAEHMTEEWYNQIRFKEMDSNPIVAIQSNNMFDLPEHVNCVHSINHMKKKFPMNEILFEGELQLKGYKRVMLIGRP